MECDELTQSRSIPEDFDDDDLGDDFDDDIEDDRGSVEKDCNKYRYQVRPLGSDQAPILLCGAN